MKRIFLITFFVLIQQSSAFGKDLRGFLQNCAYGTVTGATIGFVSLVFTDKPSDSWSNVAKGASLGLYGGIGYGLYQLNKDNKAEGQAEFAIIPKVQNGKVEGIQLLAQVINF